MTNETLGGIDLVWAGLGEDSWDMIKQGGQELVAQEEFKDLGEAILEIANSDDKEWAHVESVVQEFIQRTTPVQLSDQEVIDAEIRKNLEEVESGC